MMLDASPYYEPIEDGLGASTCDDDDDRCGWCGDYFGDPALRSRNAPALACGVSMPCADGSSFTIAVCIGECTAEAHAAARRLRSERMVAHGG